ncbi:PREDICTED: pre-mRNA-splicing regulator female-lethal(2)D [Diuraphis noxia]|uniref:pre-mRNA-splicing regulator female-lethal(2)D n=1 Tax=Diuraphis noxia TaxID=143948 RepID=UPI00076391CD|nr:PREDICTED: pre-mRNA-splicing regulator female-lethal(2)D [Diuraphis noxia]
MVEENRTGFGQVDIVDDDNMVRLPRQRIVDMYKNAMSRVRVLEAKANEASICIRCNLLCDKKERTDQEFRKLVLREKCLLRKLTIKEQEIQDYAAQLSAMRNSIQNNSLSSLKCSLQDPAVNLLIQRLRQDLCATKIRLEETQRELYTFILFLLELDEFLQDLDEDVEGMQSTIYFLQNELQKCKASVQSTNNTENKETNPKSIVNGIKKDEDTTTETLTKSKTEIPSRLVKTNSDNKSNKHSKPKDSKQLNDDISNKPKVKKIRPATVEGTDQSEQLPKVHKSKHKSDDTKTDDKRKKSEKRAHSKDEIVHKKSKSELPKNIEVKTPVEVINGLPNGS